MDGAWNFNSQFGLHNKLRNKFEILAKKKFDTKDILSLIQEGDLMNFS